MARIRTIKPEFPQSETVGRLSRDARLLFIQLWTIVDDAGRARAPSRMLASLLYPYDDDARDLIEGWLAELEREGCVRRYEVDGASFLEILNWLKHQKIDKPSESRLPSFDDASAKPREVSRKFAPDLGPRTKTKDQGPKPSALRANLVRELNVTRDEFDQRFWPEFPNKVGKEAAWRAFQAVRKKGASCDVIIHGVARYVRDKPAERQWLNPATFLNQHRWEDQPADVAERCGDGRGSWDQIGEEIEDGRRAANGQPAAGNARPALPPVREGRGQGPDRKPADDRGEARPEPDGHRRAS